MKTTRPTSNMFLPFAATLFAGASLHAAPVIHEPFAQTAGSISGKAGGTGLNNWAVEGTASTVSTSPTLAYGQLAFSGGQLSVPTGGAITAYVTTTSALADADLLDDGATLWFSYQYSKGSGGGINERSGFAFGTDRLVSISTTGAAMSNSGNGLGVYSRDKSIQPSVWVGGGAGTQGTGTTFANYGDTVLVVGRIVWGATSGDVETLTIWTPDEANLPPDVAALGTGFSLTMTGVDQTAFDTISMQQRNSGSAQIYDEVRFGANFADVLPKDTVAPTLVSITDDKAGGPIGEDVDIITYDLTFDRHMDLSTIAADDFENIGDATISIGAITQPSPAIIRVQVLPTTIGTVQLRIPAGKDIKSLAQVSLDTTSAHPDDTTITISAGNTPNTPGSNRWWDLATTGQTDGVSQGGTGNWNTTTTNWDRGAGFEAPVAWNNTNGNTAIFGGTAGTVTLDEDITLNGLTVNLPNGGGSGYSIGNDGEDNTLTFTGDKLVTTTATGTGTNQDVIIRAGIAGSPTMNIAGRATDNIDNFQLLPGAGVTQTIGTINMLNTFASNKRLVLGGSSTGNVVDDVTWPAATNSNQLMLTKAGTGSWTINNDVIGNFASRLYVEQGTLTLGGTNNIFSHKVGVATNRQTTFTASNQISKLIAKGTFTILDNREYFFVQNLGTLSPGPGVETLTVKWNGTTAGTHAQFNMQTGSTYEWDIASATSTDIINVQRNTSPSGSLTLGDITIKVNDAGVSAPIASTDQLPVFTYQTGVTRSIGTVSIDITGLGAGWSGTPSLVDDANGTIYITGLTFSTGPATPYDTWVNSFDWSGYTTPDLTATGNPDTDAYTNLQEFAFAFNPSVSDGGGTLTISGGTITQNGPPQIHVDSVTGQYFLRYTRRADYATAGITYTAQFAADSLGAGSFESVTGGSVVATGIGAGGVSIEAVSIEFPDALPVSGKKARFGRVEVTQTP